VSLPPIAILPLRVRVGYAFGSVAYGVKDNGFATFLLVFYNQVMGLDPSLVGLVLLGALLLDAVVDPIVGTLSDRTHTRWGKRHPWMYGAIAPFVIAWTMLWFPPVNAGNWLYAYLLVFAFLLRASVSCYEVPALSVVPALSSDYDERTSLTRWRFLFGWAGGLTMAFLAFGIFLVPEPGYPVGQLNVNGFHKYAITGAAFIIVATLVSSLTTHRRLAKLPDTARPHALSIGATLRQMRQTLGNRAFLILLFSTICTFTCQGVAFSGTIYMLGYYWGLPSSGFALYTLTLFFGVVGAFCMAGLLQSRMEKPKGAAVAGVAAVIISLSPYALRPLGVFPDNGSAALIPLLFSILSVGNAFSVFGLILGQSMLSDVVEASQEITGRREEGLFSAGYFFVQKCTTGLGIAIMGSILTVSHFPKTAKPGTVAQSVVSSLGFYYTLVILVFGLLAALSISRFPITRASHLARVRTLAEQSGA
jgi:glycoside/pentoside/hexuronide:cation symporter, GPH family